MSLDAMRMAKRIVDALESQDLIDSKSKAVATEVWKVIAEEIISEIVGNAEISGVTGNPTDPLVGSVK